MTVRTGRRKVRVNNIICTSHLITYGDRDSSVGIATRFELNSSGFELGRGGDIQHPSRPALRPTQPPIQWLPGPLPGGKAAGAWR